MRAATRRDLAEALGRLSRALADRASSSSSIATATPHPLRGRFSACSPKFFHVRAGAEAGKVLLSPKNERSEILKDLLAHASRPAWNEPGMTQQRAAETLGSFLGLKGDKQLKPGDVVDIPKASMLRLLEEASGGIRELRDVGRPAMMRERERQTDRQRDDGSVPSLSPSSPSRLEPLNELDSALFVHADSVTRRFFGDQVYLRGIVEFSNICANDCGYCGIRKFQPNVKRYTMKEEEIVNAAQWALEHGMGTLMLQSGELLTEKRLRFVEGVVRRVRAVRRSKEEATDGGESGSSSSSSSLAVALSIGELDAASYLRMVDAGASRYLLRIETSNPRLFASLHPPKQLWEARLRSLRAAKGAGLQLGTGVMVGLPGQTLDDLASDLVFFKEIGADMIGIGPYITEPGTPVAARWEEEFGGGGGGGGGGRVGGGGFGGSSGGVVGVLAGGNGSSSIGDNEDEQARRKRNTKQAHMEAMVSLTTRVNALARITLGNVNIAATTALQALHPRGRELALRRGANVLMPILTPTQYRADYSLYEGKPCITDTAAGCEACLSARVASVGLSVARGVWGDPPHATRLAEADAVVVEEEERERSASGGGEGIDGKGKASGSGQQRRSFSSSAPSSSSFSLSSCSSFAVPSPPPHQRLLSKEDTSALPRTNVAFVGAMNSGKSTALCALAPGAAIVDETPGTTADVKIALAEGHGEILGPLKLMDTAGVDEAGPLGAKKRDKAFRALRESDIAVVVVDVAAKQIASTSSSSSDPFSWERQLLAAARDAGATPLLLLNMKKKSMVSTSSDGNDDDAVASLLLRDAAHAARDALDPEHSVLSLEIDLAAAESAGEELGSKKTQLAVANRLTEALAAAFACRGGPAAPPPALPAKYLSRDAAVLLVIPMDAETPGGRLLRPQALVQEEALRAYARVVAVRLDLGAARGEKGAEALGAERERFDAALASMMMVEKRGSDRSSSPAPPPRLVVTDSQAIDVVHEWTLSSGDGEEGVCDGSHSGKKPAADERAASASADGSSSKGSSTTRTQLHHRRSPLVDVTTFSVAMAVRQSGGTEQLALMVEGIAAARGLKEGARVLVAEACNHNRITLVCNDIGLVQIPRALEK